MTEEKQTLLNESENEAFDEVSLLKRLRRIRIANIWTVRLFFTVFFAVAVVALIIPLRPTYSEAEKRELTRFPKFTAAALFSGEYFTDIDKWYSDTFPARDSFTDLNTRITMLYGKNDVQIHGEVEVGDIIPSVEASSSAESSATDNTVTSEETVTSNNAVSSVVESPSQTESSNVSAEASLNAEASATTSSVISSSGDKETSSVTSSGVSSLPGNTTSSLASSEASSSQSSTEVSSAESSAVASSNSSVTSSAPPAPTTQTLGALLINGNTAYEYYNFSKAAADVYTAAVNRAGALLNGKARVYDLIIPTSMAITAPESLVAGVNTSDQKAAIDYMHSKLTAPVKYVPLYDMLKSHSDEYIYFRTDHHWTALGAYYSYCELMKSMGVASNSLDSFIKHEFTGFLGSFYSSSGKLPQLSGNPDTVYAFEPTATNKIRILSKNGVWFDSNIISDMSASAASSKYLTFIRGDNAQSVIINPTLNDGSAGIVVKESFGNAFVPFLVPHYQYLYVIDYRYFSELDSRGLVQYTADAAAKDVIFINNISATRSKTLMGYIDAFVR